MKQLSEKTLGDWLEHWASHTPDKEYIGHSCISPWQYNHVIQRLWTL